METDYVGGLQQHVQFDKRHTQFFRTISRGMKCPGDHLHTDRICQPRHFRTDIAGANKTQGFSLEHHVVLSRPGARLHLRGEIGRALGESKHHPEHMLRDNRRRATRLITDNNPVIARGIEVNHICTNRAGCYHLQVWKLAEFGFPPLDRPARVHNHFCIFDARNLFCF